MTVWAGGFGVSQDPDTFTAVAEAVSQATQQLEDGTQTKNTRNLNQPLTMAFVSATVIRDIEQVRQAFVEKLPNGSLIHGLTSSGSILSTTDGAQEGAVGCLLVRADEGDFATGYAAKDSMEAARALQEQMPHPQAIFMSTTPGEEENVLASLDKNFPNVPVFGGTAADNELNGEWMVWNGQESSETGVSLVGVGPTVRFGASMLGPYSVTKKKCIATKTEGRRVWEIDDKPAADWVWDWLGNSDDIKSAYEDGGLILPSTAQNPIGYFVKKERKSNFWNSCWPSGAAGDYVTSHCAALGGKEKWVDFFTPIPQGCTLVVMDSDNGAKRGYAVAFRQAYQTAAKALKGSRPKAGLLVFCGGMVMAVGDEVNDGLAYADFVKKTKNFPVMGITCFGEQACLPTAKVNMQRNLSVGMILFG